MEMVPSDGIKRRTFNSLSIRFPPLDSFARRRYTCLISLTLGPDETLHLARQKARQHFQHRPMHELALSLHVAARFRFGLLEPRDDLQRPWRIPYRPRRSEAE